MGLRDVWMIGSGPSSTSWVKGKGYASEGELIVGKLLHLST